MSHGTDTITLAILDGSGDTKTIWSRSNPDEVENARRTFADLRAKRFLIFRVKGPNGDRGEQMTEFDASAESMIAVPPMVGG